MPFYLPSYLPPQEPESVALPDILEWAGVEYDSEIVEQAKSRLLYQYQKKPRMERFLSALMRPLQEVRKASWDVFTLTNVETAEGDALDTLGDIVGEPRRDRLDDVYRRWIRARIRANRSDGKASDLYAVLGLLYPEYAARITDRFPNAVDLELLGAIDDLAGDINRLVQDARAAGHQIEFIYAPEADYMAFGSTVSGEGGILGSTVSGTGDTMGGVYGD